MGITSTHKTRMDFSTKVIVVGDLVQPKNRVLCFLVIIPTSKF